ncbi:class I SAM-dependent methyltransferase [Streptomonospora litoralis]|uniref:Malonyl-[acyl-carrier protein] O-methyltransferase n=1 Tax=Streptomonospora litoralis TaxID=2498135 RepID=A0A4P6Q054_9ACTN|nr:class I SAM-dependent methyltransferase [Streptomonospora litoralis]QBI53986.1 Malonyl-[acyl-carrier protein] O-methyltransferase [Streptomonospora litoralis]
MSTDRVSATTDRRLLAEHAYRNDAHLSARQKLYDFQQPTYDLPGLVVDALDDTHRTVLDLGCGNGAYLDRLRSERPQAAVIGIDAAPGMLDELAPPVLCADAADLPFKAERVDAVLAMHMLYHLADIDAALAEIARVLAPGGLLVASTNAEDDKGELDDLWQAAAGDVLGTGHGPRRIRLSDHFPLDAGAARLREHFAEVKVHELTGRIVVDDPAPVLDHLGSYRTWAAQAGVPFDETLQRARERLEGTITSAGMFTVSTRQGIIRAAKPGRNGE